MAYAAGRRFHKYNKKKMKTSFILLAPRVGFSLSVTYAAGRRFHKYNKKKMKTSFILLAPRVGFEPTTLRLTVACSTAELTGNISSCGFKPRKCLYYNILFELLQQFLKDFYQKFLLCICCKQIKQIIHFIKQGI